MAFAARVILLDMTLSMPAQGCTVLLGPSGTGKSTLVRTLAGLNDANPCMRTWGRCDYQGSPLSPTHRPALVGQKAHLLMATVQDNMVAKLSQRASLTRACQIDLVRDFLQQTGQGALATRLATPVIDLALHEQRMIAILRQALPGPALLMVDEPTANLSPDGAQAVLAMLQTLADKCAVLMVSHHLAQTRQIASQVILMADGVVHESATRDDFFLRPQTTAAQHYLRTGSCPESGISHRVVELAMPGSVAVRKAPPARQAPASAQAAAALAPIADAPATPAAGGPQWQRWQDFQHSQPSPAAKSAFCGPRGFVWLIEGRLAGTPWPGIMHDTEHDLQALRNADVTRLISLTETPFAPALAAHHGIACTSVPILDMHAPSLRQAWFLCQEIDRCLRADEVVAVHCKAGLGRTGTVLALYWIWRGGGRISANEAIGQVRRRAAAMIQSPEQEIFLEQFAELLAHPSAGTIGSLPDQSFPAEFFNATPFTESPP